jgi:hypothetical protein
MYPGGQIHSDVAELPNLEQLERPSVSRPDWPARIPKSPATDR